ncbi:MAG: PAS domain-containing protein, partial [Rickettsiales bacterium]|nr:PAS domain-containing protein [Rickettsiales bacterium]
MVFSFLFKSSAVIDAISRSQAVIEFALDGTILTANENFLNTMGYSLDEIKGEHHSMFADSSYANSQEYKDFWQSLREGNFSSGRFQRKGKGGREVWIEASYNPILNAVGKPYKVIKFATDITDQVRQDSDYKGQIEAIGKSQAVIHFEVDGTIQWANENFLATMGYSLDEIQGKHHSMFAEPDYAQSTEYKEFWAKLGRGEFQSAEYRRLGKGGKEVWIQASYNPIIGTDGKPFKVVKYATDITVQKLNILYYSGHIIFISKSQAVFLFVMDGTIQWANENFLATMGYS